MSISDYLNKIKSKVKNRGDFTLSAAIILSLVLGIGFGRLWGLQTSRSPITIIEPIQAVIASSSQATVITTSQEVVKSAGKSSGKPAIEPAGRYVASKNSTKYHLTTCPGASQIKEENKRWFDSKEAAEKAGLTPAANCPGI